ncbi:MAG: LysR family transcriptional regulator [Flavobacterium sp. MedPE-SWcel]|uniref:LysR family transcriptional regulator n=1 Tax=uncultured Flavobacterium sp. TaxID=165435 RepID=UPI00091C81B6|nr:LysR family transcriptional regulator [uncultured Flavobacterium sp.]OIQ15586.1 MAG: LysR family transcriptional regulator [Flavobacterium sp. MedPE-SWcel]
MKSNLEWFRTFKSIYETGTMSGAAKQLYVSQPGIGLHLNALEAYTGYPLFERTPRKMIPTEKGKLLYQQMINSLSCMEDLEARFQYKSGKERATLSVGMCVETFQQILEKHIPDLTFNLIMQFGNTNELIQSLENGSADLILTTSETSNNNLIYTPFAVERFVVVAGVNTDISGFNRLKKNKESIKKWLKSQLWYSTASDMDVLNLFWERNFDERPNFLPNYIVPNKFSIIRCLSRGEGIAILPDFLCKEAIDNKKVFKIWEGYTPLENTLYFGKRKQSILMDEIKHIENILLSEF